MDENLYFLTCAPDVYLDGRIKGAPFPCFYVSPTEQVVNMPLERFRKCYLEGSRLSVVFRVYDGTKVSEENTIYLLEIAGYDTFEQLHLNIFEKSQGPDLIPGLRYQVTFKDYVTLPTVTTFGLNEDGTAIELSISNQPIVSLDITGLQIPGVGDTITDLEISPDSRTITLSANNPVGAKQLVIGLDPIVNSIDTVTASAAANATAIASQGTRLTTAEGNITTNTLAIAGNASAIATNTTAIAGNATAITTNTSAIASHGTRLTTAEGTIATNTTAIATNTTAIAGNATAITALTTRVTAEEAATAQAILRDGGLSFERCIVDLSPDIVMTSQNVFPADITNIFSATSGVVTNNASSLGSASILTNPAGKRSLLLPSGNTLKWNTPNVSFTYNTGCTFAIMLGDWKFSPTTSGDWIEYFMASPVASPAYNQTDRYLYGLGTQSNFSLNGDINSTPLVSTPELENYSSGVYHMVIFRFLGNKAEMFITRNGRATTPDVSLTDAAVSSKPAVSYFAINGGGAVISRTGNTEVVGVYQWARALTDYEINYLRVASNGYTDTMNYLPMAPATYPKVSMMAMYTPSSTGDEPNAGTTVFQLTTRAWVLGTGSSIGGTLNTSNGTITLTKVGRDSATATVRCRISAGSSRVDGKGVRLNQLIFLNGTELLVPGGVGSDTTSFETSCMMTTIANLKKGDTIQLRYQSSYGTGGNAKDLIFNRAVLLIEEM
jgi:hypothetical protein